MNNRCYGQKSVAVTVGAATAWNAQSYVVTGNGIWCTAAGVNWYGIDITGEGVTCTEQSRENRRIGLTRIQSAHQGQGDRKRCRWKLYTVGSIGIDGTSTNSTLANTVTSSAISDLGSSTRLVNNVAAA